MSAVSGPPAAYTAAHAAYRRARQWELSGEAFDLGEGPEPVEAAWGALTAGMAAVAEFDVPDNVHAALIAASAAHEAAEIASVRAESWTPEGIDADHEAWEAFCTALDALGDAFQGAGL